MKSNWKKLLSLALVLALMAGFAPGMGLTALAGDETPAYAGLKNTINVVKFDSKDWYLIDYDDSSVTLLTKECVGASKFNPNEPDDNTYSGSMVESFVNSWYTEHISEDAKAAVNGSGMFLLTKDQAIKLSTDVLKCSKASGAYSNDWWLCSPGSTDSSAERVNGDTGVVNGVSGNVWIKYGVRPALKLDLSKVVFSDNTFALPVPPVASVTSGDTTTKYTTFAAALGAWADGATLTLLSDVTISSTLNVSGTRTLDLNGYGVLMKGTERVISVQGNASLTLNDSNPGKSNYITLNDYRGTSVANSGVESFSNGNGVVKVDGGYLTGGIRSSGESGPTAGAGVLINQGGTFVLNGGTIVGNTITNNNSGSGVRNDNGIFTMNGGKITYNKAGRHGGGLTTTGSENCTVHGGEISNNYAALSGGGVQAAGSFALTGGSIVNNASGNPGGGVYAGGGLTISGNVKITGNTASGKADNLYLASNNLTVSGNLADGAQVGVNMQTPGVFTNSTDTAFNDASKFISDNASYAVRKNADGQLELRVPPAASVTSGVTTTEYAAFSDAVNEWNNAANDATLKLLSDVTTITINFSGTKTLDLNGHSLTGNGNGTVIKVNGGSLTVNGKNGTITGGKAGEGGAFFITSNGKVTLNDCTLKGNEATNVGDAFFIQSSGGGGSAIINNCTIIGRGKDKGAALWLQGHNNPDTSFTMKGGSISNFKIGVWVQGKTDLGTSMFTMNGGTISDNLIGVKNEGPNSKVIVSGDAIISNNDEKNLELNDGIKVTVNSALGKNAKIGIYMGNSGVFTNSTPTDYNDATKFTSDNASYAVGKNAAGQLFLGSPVTVTFDTDGGSAVDTQTVAGGSVIAQPADPTKEGYTFDGWYTDSDLTTTFDFSTPISADTTLYAKWTNKQYTVGGEINYGSYTGTVTVSLLEGGEEKYSATVSLNNGSGTYSFTHVPVGTYTLRAVWIEGGKETILNETLSVP